MYNYILIIYVNFAIYFAEIVNILCWIDFIIQMNMYSSCDAIDYDYMIEITKKERYLVYTIVTLGLIYLLPCIAMTITIFIGGCGDCNPFIKDSD